RILYLESEIAEQEKELEPGGDAQHIVARHIKPLHHYNEAKDAGSCVICVRDVLSRQMSTYMHLAADKHTTIRQIHEDYGL
ncbi:hypothetical protein EI94DRAFT_1521090, partial [Lactarius quietus]